MFGKQTFAASLAPGSFDETDNSIGLVIYTGATVQRQDYRTGEVYTLSMVVSPEAVDLSRIDAGTCPLLDSHSSHSLADQIGCLLPGSARIEAGQLLARASLSVDPAKAGIVADIRAGVIRGVSVGADILETVITEATATTGRQVRATKWAPYEASMTPTPADMNAQTFSRQAGAEVQKMDPKPEALNVAEIKQAERLRCAEIDRVGQFTKAPTELIAQLKSGDVDIDSARKQLLDAAVAEQAKTPTAPQIRLVRDAGDTAIEQARAALLANANPSVGKFTTDPLAQDLRGRRVSDIARHALSIVMPREEALRLNDRDAIRRAFGFQQFAHSSSDFPDLLGDSVGKALLYSFQAIPKQYESFCKAAQTPGLHARKPVILSGASAISEIPESGGYPEQTLGDTAESYSAKKYGGVFSVTLEALLRDDLDGLGSVPFAQAQGIIHKQNQIIAALFAEGSGYGPTLAADSVALFNSAHANLVDTGSGGAPTIARFDVLKQKLATQTDAQGNLQPRMGRIVLVPSALGMTAEQLLFGGYMPTSAATALVPSLSSLQVVTFDYLSSATKWYLLADPAMSPVIEYAVPSGVNPVWAESEISFNTDARRFKAGMYFGAAAVDYRGAAMNFGA